jgi:tetratricopeptide (TPR) repeat protein
MKIFVSYGHDHNKPIVDRIESDLKAAGYQVWKDETQIKAGNHWRRSIVDGLQDSDWVIGFLSKHSVRDPGVCLDELGIALHAKGGTIATVLLEGEVSASPPLSVSHIQWLDMHEWAERQAGDHAAFETWYRGKLDELLSVLASPMTEHFAGEIAELERRLQPVSQAADIGVLVEGFVGRDWLLARLDEWQRSAKESRLFWLSGGAGTGKSAVAAWLAHHGRANVIGLNLCRYNVDERRDAGRVLRTLAFQIATRLPDYRRLLLDRLKAQDPDGEEVKRKSPAALFSWLLVEPLNLAIDGGRSANRLLIVIDGLDETVRDGRSDLAEILSADAQKLPAWIAIVVTSRPEEPILRQFAALQPVLIEADSAENLDDVRAYIGERLAELDLPAARAEALLGRLVSASQGNFLYLRMLREATSKGTLSLNAPEGLPQGLVGLYERWFRRWFPDRRSYERYVPVLEVIAAAEHPVPEPWLAQIFAWSKRDAAAMLEGLGSLFERRPDGVSPFHKSLRDWLVDPKKAGADFVVDESAGTRRLVEVLWPSFQQWANEPDADVLDRFCVVELPRQLFHLPAAGIGRLPGLQPWTKLKVALFKVAQQRLAAYEWETALSWLRAATLLADSVGSIGQADYASALGSIGVILFALGRSGEALQSYRDSLGIRDGLAKSDPSNAEWQSELASANGRIGDVQMAQGNLAAALTSYEAKRSIVSRLAQSSPSNAGWQHDLSVAYNKVGDVLFAQGNLSEALESFRDALAIGQRLAEAEPNNIVSRRDLGMSWSKVGDALGAQGTVPVEETLACYSASLAIFERLTQGDPNNFDWQVGLSLAYDKVGKVLLLAERNLPEALKSFRASFTIMERLAQAEPDNAGWQHDLSASHSRVGDVLLAQHNLPEALKSFRASFTIMERLTHADPSNASWQHTLSWAYEKIGDVLVAQGDRSEALKSLCDALAIAHRLAQIEPDDFRWQHHLSEVCEKVGDILAPGNLQEALKCFHDKLAATQRLAQVQPNNPACLRDLSVSYRKVGNALVALGNLPEALKSFRDGLAITQRLAQAEPNHVVWQRDLSTFYEAVGGVFLRQGNLGEALRCFHDKLAIAQRLSEADSDDPNRMGDLSVSYRKVGEVLDAQGDPSGAAAFYVDSIRTGHRNAMNYALVANWHSQSNDRDSALAAARQGRAILNELAEFLPGNPDLSRDIRWFDDQIADLTK